MKPNRFNATSSQEQFLQAKQEAETAALAATNESDIDDLGDDVTELQQIVAGLSGVPAYTFNALRGTTVNLPVLAGKHLCILLGNTDPSGYKWQISYGDETSMHVPGAPNPIIGRFSNINTVEILSDVVVYWVIRIPCKSQNV